MFVIVMWLIFRGKLSKLKLCRRFECGKCFFLSLSYDGMDSGATKLACKKHISNNWRLSYSQLPHDIFRVSCWVNADKFFVCLFFSYKNCGRVVKCWTYFLIHVKRWNAAPFLSLANKLVFVSLRGCHIFCEVHFGMLDVP